MWPNCSYVSDSDVLVRDVSGPGLKMDGSVPEYSILWDRAVYYFFIAYLGFRDHEMDFETNLFFSFTNFSGTESELF